MLKEIASPGENQGDGPTGADPIILLMVME
jgi:hypothetical protein